MDDSFTHGYCQLRSETPTAERRSERHLHQRHHAGGHHNHGVGDNGGSEGDQHHHHMGFGLHGTLGPPRDRCSLIYTCLMLCGMGFLLPYNSFITAVDYYQGKFPGSTIIFDMSLTYIGVAFVGVVTNNLLVELFSLRTRICFGYVTSVLTLLCVAIFDVWYEVFDTALSYKLNLVAVAMVALGCTVQQSSFYGYTSMLPQRYTQAVMTGESAAGLMVSISRIFTKALLNDPRVNTIIFFGVSITTVLVCCIAFQVSRRTDFVRYFVSMCESAGLAEDQRGIASQSVANPEEVDILDGNVSRDNYGVLVIQSPTTPTEDRPFTSGHEQDVTSASANAMAARQNEVQIKGQGRNYRKHIPLVVAIKRGCWNRYQVARTVWPYMTSIGLAYFVTLCLFPGIESEIISCRLHSWMPVILITIFNLFDFIGKIIASVRFDWPPGGLLLCCFCRVILVPFLMLCAAPRQAPILAGEAWSMIISLLLGITNGYFGSVPMILAPSKVPDEQKELTGNIMTLSYSLGLTTGSMVAYLLDAWLGPHPGHGFCDSHNATTPFVSNNTTDILRTLTNPFETTGV